MSASDGVPVVDVRELWDRPPAPAGGVEVVDVNQLLDRAFGGSSGVPLIGPASTADSMPLPVIEP